MGVLPRLIRELPESRADASVKFRSGFLHSVAVPARIRARKTVHYRNVEQQRQVRYQSSRGQSVRGTHFFLRESSARDLVRVRRKKKTIEQNDGTSGERRADLAPRQFRARRHE